MEHHNRITLTMTSQPEGFFSPEEEPFIGSGFRLLRKLPQEAGEAELYQCEKENRFFVAKIYGERKPADQETEGKIEAIDSPYVLKPMEKGWQRKRYYEVYPYYFQGDVTSMMPAASEFLEKVLIPQLNEALAAIHRQRLVHRDVKPANILLNNQRDGILLSDLGICSPIKEDEDEKELPHTPGYASPEALQGRLTEAMDYYAFGMTLKHLTAGRSPASGLSSMMTLINGLTEKNWQHRWGYADVQDWLDQKSRKKSGHQVPGQAIRPYVLRAGQEIYDLERLAMELAECWEDGKKHLRRGFLTRHLEQFTQEMASRSMDHQEEEDPDIGLFKQVLDLNPAMPLYWKGSRFESLENLAVQILEQLEDPSEELMSFLGSGCLAYYTEQVLLQGKDTETIKKYAETVMKADKEERPEQLMKLAYSLDSEAPFVWKGNAYADLKSLTEAIWQHNFKSLGKCASSIKNGRMSYAFEAKGFSQQAIHALKHIENEAPDEKSALFRLCCYFNRELPLKWAENTYESLNHLVEAMIDKPVQGGKFIVSGDLRYYLEQQEFQQSTLEFLIRLEREEPVYACYLLYYSIFEERPFRWKGETWNTMEELAEEIDEMIKKEQPLQKYEAMIEEGCLAAYLSGKKTGKRRMDEISTLRVSGDKREEKVRKLLYILNPEKPLMLGKYEIPDLGLIRKTMLAGCPYEVSWISEEMKKGILTISMTGKGYDRTLVKHLKNLEKRFREKEKDSQTDPYWELLIILDEYRFRYREKVFKNPEELLEFFLSMKDHQQLEKWAKEWNRHPYFRTWLSLLGYSRANTELGL